MSRPGPPSRTTAVRPHPGEALPAGHRRFLIGGQLRRPLALTVWFGTCVPPGPVPELPSGALVDSS
ncbi:hypothetical protein [Streptomyces platensis]|uniref:hypothetical protein n=1 Tax=Streptomyces platensis TaxID=58346 RepID=UPI003865162F|nr:hypothetical protein OG962_03495 [Streptomyces platensis]